MTTLLSAVIAAGQRVTPPGDRRRFRRPSGGGSEGAGGVAEALRGDGDAVAQLGDQFRAWRPGGAGGTFSGTAASNSIASAEGGSSCAPGTAARGLPQPPAASTQARPAVCGPARLIRPGYRQLRSPRVPAAGRRRLPR